MSTSTTCAARGASPAGQPAHRLVAAAAALLLAVGGCAAQGSAAGDGSEPPPAVTPTVAPSTTASPSPSATPFDHGEIPPELVGTWAFEVFDKPAIVELTADGRFSMRYTTVPGAVSGSFGIFGDESIWRDEDGDVCHPLEARYRWELVGDVLTLTPVDDRCTSGRIAEWSSGWTRTDE